MSLACRVKAIIVAKAKYKSLKLPPLAKRVNLKQYHSAIGMVEINDILKYIKDAGIIVLITFPFNSTVWPLQKTDELAESL